MRTQDVHTDRSKKKRGEFVQLKSWEGPTGFAPMAAGPGRRPVMLQ